MSTLTLTADDGTQHPGTLPDSWAEVPLLPFCHLAGATTLPARIEALAALVGLPAEPLLAEVRHYAALLQAAPWLLTQLPPAGEPITEFRHLGTRYVSAGHLRTLSAGQLEAIYTMQQAHGAAPLLAAPGILAVLFVPKGRALTPELHQAGTAALASLPVSVAWPLFLAFLRSGAMECSHHIRMFSALSQAANQALDAVEQALPTSGFYPFYKRLPHWALRQWLKSARATATMPWRL